VQKAGPESLTMVGGGGSSSSSKNSKGKSNGKSKK